MAAPATPKTPPKPGISTGRIVLWGIIAVLGGVTLAEFLSKKSYDAAWTAVDEKMDEGSGQKRISEKDIEGVLPGRTPKMVTSFEGRSKAPGATKMAVYSWFSLNPSSPRSIFVYYNENGQVVQHSQVEYLTEKETQPVSAKEGESVEIVPMSAGMANMTDEQRKGLSGGYDHLMPPELKERRKKEIEAENAKKAAEEAANKPAEEDQPDAAAGTEEATPTETPEGAAPPTEPAPTEPSTDPGPEETSETSAPETSAPETKPE